MLPATTGPVAVVNNIYKRFGRVQALSDVSFSISGQEFTVLTGPSGSGKTTILRILAGLESPDSGSVQLYGSDASRIEPAQRDVALVFQNFSLYPSRTVRANLEFPLRAPQRKLTQAAIDERVERAANLLHIRKLLDRPARQLSGGEMQRVAIGRAIVRDPRLFLMDEPLSNLDAKLREELRVELKEVAHSLRTPVLWVTHDPAEALSMADRIITVREGRILQTGDPVSLYYNPSTPEVASLLGTTPLNIFDVRLHESVWVLPDGSPLATAAPGAASAARAGFRAEDVRASGGAVAARVCVVHEMGRFRLLTFEFAGRLCHLSSDRVCAISPGDVIYPDFPPEHMILWPNAEVERAGHSYTQTQNPT